MGVVDTGLIEAFTGEFGATPTHVVRSPGRVNLIGGHIDYHHLPVLPMAIDREIRLLFRRREDGRVRAMTLADDLPGVAFELSETIPAGETGDWSNYVRGVAQSMVREQDVTSGIDLLVDSTLPIAAGLSSSSALSVGAGLAIARANKIDIDRVTFAGQMAEAEHFTGTHGGGMDQAVCLLAESQHALYVEFQPLRARPILLPSGLQIIVAHSLENAEKSRDVQAAYNERRLVGESARKAVSATLGLLPDTGYRNLVDIGEPALQVATEVLSGHAADCFRHVFREAGRVMTAVDALESADLFTLGELVNDSHESLRSDYKVSTPALDELVTLARNAGALGARLTGAGFGGAMIALVSAEQAGSIRSALASGFFHPRGVSDPEDAGVLLEVQASGGASVESLEDAFFPSP